MDNKKHILLVDDDRDMLMLIERWLKKDYIVGTASSGREAVDYIAKERPDLVLLDYAMPEMSGPDTLSSLRDNPDTADLSVVFLTGMEDEESKREVEHLNPKGFWLKSMGKKNLLSEVEKIFGSTS